MDDCSLAATSSAPQRPDSENEMQNACGDDFYGGMTGSCRTLTTSPVAAPPPIQILDDKAKLIRSAWQAFDCKA